MKGKAQGISLIVLVITIIVIIILAGAVILSMIQNNPTTKAKEAIFKTDIATYKDELTMYHLSKTVNSLGSYEKSSINKTGQGLKELIPSIKEADISKFEVKAGELIYIGEDENEIEWSKAILEEPSNLPEVPEEETGWNETKGVNSPVLAEGMTPIKWNGTDWINTTANDTDWYNYENKEWANAKTQDGSFWVWIPRYEYKISNPHTSTAEEIQVKFIKDTKKEVTSGYIMHPGFTFGEDELTGIWVAKFEASGTKDSIDIKPNITSLRNIDISNIFTAIKNMEINDKYGWGTSGNGIDTHLIKNTEWGAVAYLSHSKYGKNAEVWINPNSNYITGQAGDSVSSSGTNITTEYTTANGMQASTTGNITGIYDMSGCAWEYTAAYINNGARVLTDRGLDLINSEDKYKNIYKKGVADDKKTNYDINFDMVGDAIYETSENGEVKGTSWYNDYSYMPYGSYAFFIRGGRYSDGEKSGIFYFDGVFGNNSENYGFRPVLNIVD